VGKESKLDRSPPINIKASVMNDNEHKILAFPPVAPSIAPSHLPFFVLGIGASAGGINALVRFFEQMPADNGMAFVIILHLSPRHESTLAEILQAKTRMPVLQVTETVAIRVNHVYIIPPTKDLVMQDGHLEVTPAAERIGGRHMAIDLFLRTQAEAHRERAIGIILSGAGSDGAVGIARIKETGGITFAQSLSDAEHDSMPMSAIHTGMIDHVLPVSEIPQKLMELVSNARMIKLPAAVNLELGIDNGGLLTIDDEREHALREILLTLQSRTGHDFKHYKRATVLRRIERRLQVNGLPDAIAYAAFLKQNTEETQLLLSDMLISVTNFFRDREAFEALERDIIPRIFQHAGANEYLRAWSLGCATGEEAYSLAILLADHNLLVDPARPIQVFASDIDERAIDYARRAIYPASIVTDVAPSRLRQYFEKHENYYSVKKEIREKVLFASHNLLRDPPFSRIHLITCRNLLIYLDRDIQKKVFEMLHYALHPEGYLFLGNAESADAVPELFMPVDKKNRIYQAARRRASAYYVPPQFSGAAARMPDPIDLRKHASTPKRPVQNLHWQLLQDYVPASVLIDEQQDLVYASKQAARFLQPPQGEPSNNILALVHPGLQLELRAALFQATQSGTPVETRNMTIRQGDQNITVRIVVRRTPPKHEAEGLVLILFQEAPEQSDSEAGASKASDDAIVAHLEEDLHNTKEQLRSVIDQYENTLADLKASNEELQAVNEELRSAMEELETSKEELQSVNEELLTVNVELKMKVEETTKANDDLQNFLTATQIATIFVDRHVCIKRYSKPAASLFNIIATDIDRPLPDITHRLDYPELLDDIHRVFNSLQPNEREVRGNGQDWYIARFLPYRSATDRIEGIVLTFVNITRRKAAEEKLRASEHRMRLIAASTRDYAIATMDASGIVTSWNMGAERLFGYSEGEMIGQSLAILFLPEDLARGVFEDELQRAANDGRGEDDRWHLRKDGRKVYCSGITSPLMDKDLRGFVKIARDLTGSKQAQDQQAARLQWEQQERVRAQESARLRDEFFAVLSHELKQPLNLIQLTAEMLVRQPDTARLPHVARSAATIQQSVESQVKIIDDLMDLSRLHTGKLSLHWGQVNFSSCVAAMIELARPDALRKRISIVFEPGSGKLIVHGDKVRIEQIVWNLLNNAFKFTPVDGRVLVGLSQSEEFACLEISDTGRGIAHEFLPFVFDMFKQADSGTSRQHGGMGIGLALVKELASSHGGRVEAHSGGIGQGATFRVYLPLATSGQDALTVSSDEPVNLSEKRILLVDDSQASLEPLTELLTMQNALVTAACSGSDAISIVAKSPHPFHLIISDIGMPGMDGYALLAELRKLEGTANTPAIALSGFTRENNVNEALAAGFVAHMPKPVSLEQLLETAGRIMRTPE
jgi:two-component system, chemotaxis family, CheB/CheR fusion protein